MRRFTMPAALVAMTGLCLGLWMACTDSNQIIDDDVEKRRDLALPQLDLSGIDLAGGGGGDLAGMSGDMKTGADLAMSGDMKAGTDLATGGDMKPAMDSGASYTCRGTDAPGTTYKVVTDSLTLPKSTGTRTYNYDFDGDGKAENKLRTLIQVIALAGLDLQASVDLAVASGTTLQLASLTTSDVTSSTCSGVLIVPAKPTLSPPKFDGTDVLDKVMTAPATLIGAIAAGKLTTKASKDLASTEDSPLELSLSLGGMTLTLPLHGLHLEGTVERTGSLVRIKDGALHGVISATDLDMRLVPAIADQITRLINSDPMSSTTMTIIALFENMANAVTKTKCMTPSMCCKTSPATCVILPAEVKASPIGGVLTPDVEVFDGGGAWKPVPGGRSPNGMTLGVGITAITAAFP